MRRSNARYVRFSIPLLQRLLAMLALLGYFANAAQPHLVLHSGATITLLLCSGNAPKTVHLAADAPAERTDQTCCGDCITALALPPVAGPALIARLRYAPPKPPALAPRVHPRSPLWPGAPPQGPPVSQTA